MPRADRDDLTPVLTPGKYFSCYEHDGTYTPESDWIHEDGNCGACTSEGEDDGRGEVVHIVALTSPEEKDAESYAGRLNAIELTEEDAALWRGGDR